MFKSFRLKELEVPSESYKRAVQLSYESLFADKLGRLNQKKKF